MQFRIDNDLEKNMKSTKVTKLPKVAKPAINDLVRAAHAELVRVEALLECIAFCLKYADPHERDDTVDCTLIADMAMEQVASAVDKLDSCLSA